MNTPLNKAKAMQGMGLIAASRYAVAQTEAVRKAWEEAKEYKELPPEDTYVPTAKDIKNYQEAANRQGAARIEDVTTGMELGD